MLNFIKKVLYVLNNYTPYFLQKDVPLALKVQWQTQLKDDYRFRIIHLYTKLIWLPFSQPIWPLFEPLYQRSSPLFRLSW